MEDEEKGSVSDEVELVNITTDIRGIIITKIHKIA